ncbi:MAG: type II toxin-antitoxin system Phd/YefM family antitoxin [Thiotrichales bacterium]
MKQETIEALEFSAKCLRLIKEVSETGKEIVISNNGVPVSKLVPIQKKPETLFGLHKGQVKIKEDIVTPIDLEWDAAK